jgi:predicted nucleic acid-binding protein
MSATSKRSTVEYETRVVFDTNVVLDVLCDRLPFSSAAKALWDRVARSELSASMVATSVTNIFYIVRKARGIDVARQAIADLLILFDICPVTQAVLETARRSPIRDFEDAVQDAASEHADIPVIITRDVTGFVGSTRRIVDPAQFCHELDQLSGNVPPASRLEKT